MTIEQAKRLTSVQRTRLRKKGWDIPILPNRAPRQPCSVYGCSRPSSAKGVCNAHYQRLIRLGDVMAGVPLCLPRDGERNANWRGGERYDRGRTLTYKPEHPYAVQGYVYRYRLVMEAKLGRYLLPDEIVHHKDEDVTNDAPGNLEVTNQSAHARHHSAKTSIATVVAVKRLRRDGASCRAIAVITQLPLRRVRAICDGETWKDIRP